MTLTDNIIDNTKYQVFLFTSPAIFPYFFAVHPWFVVNKQGGVSRWELLSFPNQTPESWEHIHKNAFSPTQGIRMLPFSPSPHWSATRRESISGSAAKDIITTIESTPDQYPFYDQYSLLGPNSNTYVQWVLNQHPEFDASLPWNAFGKNFTGS